MNTCPSAYKIHLGPMAQRLCRCTFVEARSPDTTAKKLISLFDLPKYVLQQGPMNESVRYLAKPFDLCMHPSKCQGNILLWKCTHFRICVTPFWVWNARFHPSTYIRYVRWWCHPCTYRRLWRSFVWVTITSAIMCCDITCIPERGR